MKAFYENVRFGSHADRVVGGTRGLVYSAKNPPLAATAVANALTVATNAFVIGRARPACNQPNSFWRVAISPSIHRGEGTA